MPDRDEDKPIEQMHNDLLKYITTYGPMQPGWEKFSRETYILDVLYGLGVALDRERYENADGFRRFMADLELYIRSNRVDPTAKFRQYQSGDPECNPNAKSKS